MEALAPLPALPQGALQALQGHQPLIQSKLPAPEALRPFKADGEPGSCSNITDLNSLIRELHQVFSEDVVNVEHVHELMASYKSNPADWKKFAKFDRYRYTRNLVDEGNGKFNLMILCWGEGHGSAIHDHANAHCFMKMLQGTLSEVRFAWPDDDAQDADEPSGYQPDQDDWVEGRPLQEMGRSNLLCNDVCYINDSMGLHRVENPSHTDRAVSLHLYCPPFNTCSVFNQQTGQRSHCKVTFWSKFGQKAGKEAQTVSRAPEDN